MAEHARPDVADADVAATVAKNSPLKSDKCCKTDNPYGDAAYDKGVFSVLKRLGAGKKYVAR